jgi:hypothetical protein
MELADVVGVTADGDGSSVRLHDRLIGSFFTKDKNRYERGIADGGKALNEKVRLYAQVGSALIGAKEAGSDPFGRHRGNSAVGALYRERF